MPVLSIFAACAAPVGATLAMTAAPAAPYFGADPIALFVTGGLRCALPGPTHSLTFSLAATPGAVVTLSSFGAAGQLVGSVAFDANTGTAVAAGPHLFAARPTAVLHPDAVAVLWSTTWQGGFLLGAVARTDAETGGPVIVPPDDPDGPVPPVATVPEPSTFALAATALVLLALGRRWARGIA